MLDNKWQTVKSEIKKCSISFKNYFKQLPVPFKIYADFECLLRGAKSSDKNNGSYTEKYQDHIPCSFAYNIVCIGNKFKKRVALYSGKNAAYKFIEAVLEEYDYCKNMSVEEEERFQLSNSCWICEKLFDVGDDKVRDHCQITGKYRGAAHLNRLKRCLLYFII